MRIIGGTARGRKLVTFRGDHIRPTSDRMREALFSILISKRGSLSGLTVLDLFAGSGALGIEALSRGAAGACFVDQLPDSLATIRRNLETCGLTEKAELFQANVLIALPAPLQQTAFDLVLLDPPYGGDHVAKALEVIGRQIALAEHGLIVAEAGVRDNVPSATDSFAEVDRRRYGSSALHFFHRMPHEP